MFRKLSLYEFKCNNALHNSLRSFIKTSMTQKFTKVTAQLAETIFSYHCVSQLHKFILNYDNYISRES